MRIFPLLFLSVLILPGCKSYPIKTYSIPKETLQVQLPQMTEAHAEVFTWTLPKGWVQGPSSDMRLASFGLGKAGLEVTLVGLPGQNDLLANVNRWCGQIHHSPIDKSLLSSVSTSISHSQFDMTLVELYGPQKGIVAVLFEYNEQTYFIKLMGSASDVKLAKPDFLNFVKSVNHAKH